MDCVAIGEGKELVAIGTESGKIWLYILSISEGGEVKDELLKRLNDM